MSGLELRVGRAAGGARSRWPTSPGVGVVPRRAEGAKCARCWQVLAEVGSIAAAPDLCRRCSDAVGALAAA